MPISFHYAIIHFAINIIFIITIFDITPFRYFDIDTLLFRD